MTEEELETELFNWLGDEDSAPSFDLDFEGNEVTVEAVHTFAQSGVLTHNRGLAVRISDGSEFQLTIVQSKDPR